VAKLPHEARDFRMHTMPAGFGSWVAGQTADGTPVPHWKSFLLVLVALYPVVMLLALIVSPRTAGLGMAFAMLVGNILSVAILEWAVMPLLNRALAPWLAAHGRTAASCRSWARHSSQRRCSGWRWSSGSRTADGPTPMRPSAVPTSPIHRICRRSQTSDRDPEEHLWLEVRTLFDRAIEDVDPRIPGKAVDPVERIHVRISA